MTFGEKLRELREGAGETQQSLAIKAGLPLGTVRNYEQGVRMPLLPAVAKIARALGKDCSIFQNCSDVLGDSAPATKKRPRSRG